MLEIIIWDVQHGSSTYVNTPNGKHIIIDLGIGKYSNGNQFSPLLHLKEIYGVRSVDQVIITHPHTDHIDDIMNFDVLYPKVLTRPGHLTHDDIRKANPSSDSQKVNKYIEIDKRYNKSITAEKNPKLPENNGGVTIKTFTPRSCSVSNINNHSIVNIIEYLGIKVIIPGDNESASWKELLQDSSFVDAIKNADIFVASHHGRESGYYADLFNHFKPDLVIVSDGPTCTTSISNNYTYQAKGWNVIKRNGYREVRRCLTTRRDGVIEIKIGKNGAEKYMEVTID